MSIRTQREFERLRVIGRIVRLALEKTAAVVRPGITTRELDRIGAGDGDVQSRAEPGAELKV